MKTQSPSPVDEAAADDDVVIACAGKASASPRLLGRLAGNGTVPPGFDDPLPDSVLDAFDGG